MTKNAKIAASGRATRERRMSQECKVFELKVDVSHFSNGTLEKVRLYFLEAKWLHNYVLAQEDVFSVDYKISEVDIKVKDKFEKREIKTLGSQVRQGVLNGIKQNVLNLSKKKKKGHKVGRLKFISRCDSIELKQFSRDGKPGVYRIKGSKVKIQNIDQWLRVRGIEQLEGYDIANAKFMQKASGYYLKVTAFRTKVLVLPPQTAVGIDFGIKSQLTLSDGLVGIDLNYITEFPKKLRRLHKKLSKKENHSSNWYKALTKANKEFEHWSNQKLDTRNKILSLLKNFGVICYQNENIKSWKRVWGSRILSTGIGGITARLNKTATSVRVDRFFASTKLCPCCEHKQDIGLEERMYHCDNCGYTAHRDWKAATCILKEGLKQIGVEYADYKPVEIKTSTLNNLLERFQSIPRLKASLICETGSLTPLCVR